MSKLWGGRFSKDSSKLMEDFHSSISFDQALYFWDILGSKAHGKMLAKVGVLSQAEADQIVRGLEAIQERIEAGEVEFRQEDEDIHMNIERLLTEAIGPVGKKLHTGRSRNDQVALDLRMYLRSEVVHTQTLLCDLIEVLITKAQDHIDTIMPAYTHLQRAQPINFSHHLLAYVEMFRRDYERLDAWLQQHNWMPLGSGALAGTTYPLDRDYTADLLRFEGPNRNSLDGVSDRDFVLDYLHAAAVSMMHLSRLSEEIILWSSQEFAFIDLDDAYATGSSIMPQKKNPDAAELVRGKTGRVYGNLMALLTTMKGLPLAYNKDMQEDKEGLFDSVATWQKSLRIFAPMLATMTVNTDRMAQAARGGFTNATDLADYLVRQGLPFRDAHEVVGKCVADALSQGISLEKMPLATLQAYEERIQEDVYQALDIGQCVTRRQTYGGPASDQVTRMLARHQSFLEGARADLAEKIKFHFEG